MVMMMIYIFMVGICLTVSHNNPDDDDDDDDDDEHLCHSEGHWSNAEVELLLS